MKIHIVLPNLRGGGVQRNLLNLGSELQFRGHRVELLVANMVGSVRDAPSNLPVTSMHAPPPPLLVPWLVPLMRKKGLFLVGGFAMIVAALVANRLGGRRSMVVPRIANPLRVAARTDRGRLRRLYRTGVENMGVRLLGDAAGIVCNSEGTHTTVQAALHDRQVRTKVIPNPVISEAVHRKAREPIADSYGLCPKTEKWVVTVGRLHYQKNQELLIKAFACLTEIVDARLLIIGSGPEERRLRQAADRCGVTERTAFLGFLSNPYNVIASSDVFVLSSRWEGFGNVIVEALALGVNVVCTRCAGGPREILKDGEFGWLVPTDDYVALANAMLRALADPLPKDHLMARGNMYDVSASADGYEEFLRGIVAEH